RGCAAPRPRPRGCAGRKARDPEEAWMIIAWDPGRAPARAARVLAAAGGGLAGGGRAVSGRLSVSVEQRAQLLAGREDDRLLLGDGDRRARLRIFHHPGWTAALG